MKARKTLWRASRKEMVQINICSMKTSYPRLTSVKSKEHHQRAIHWRTQSHLHSTRATSHCKHTSNTIHPHSLALNVYPLFLATDSRLWRRFLPLPHRESMIHMDMEPLPACAMLTHRGMCLVSHKGCTLNQRDMFMLRSSTVTWQISFKCSFYKFIWIPCP